jgi:hypothetical protein
MEELIVKIAAVVEWRELAIVWGELVEAWMNWLGKALLATGTFTIASVAIFEEWGGLL